MCLWTVLACRWLIRRLPGFTHLVCDATYANDYGDYDDSLGTLCDAKSAAIWIVAQLPKLCSGSTSTFKLHLKLDSGMTPHIPAMLSHSGWKSCAALPTLLRLPYVILLQMQQCKLAQELDGQTCMSYYYSTCCLHWL